MSRFGFVISFSSFHSLWMNRKNGVYLHRKSAGKGMGAGDVAYGQRTDPPPPNHRLINVT